MSKEKLIQQRLDRALDKMAHLQALIDQGNLSWLTRLRLNHVCGRIEKLDRAILDHIVVHDVENK